MAKEKEKAPENGNDKLKNLDAALKSINKNFGQGAAMRLGEKPIDEIEVIPTGSLSLDVALGVGGVPRGRVVEIYGPESSGKTTVALHIIAEAQKTAELRHLLTQSMPLTPCMRQNWE